jgi:hypothetical protein
MLLFVVFVMGQYTEKITMGMTVRLNNVQHVPSISKNLVAKSLLCKDGFKLVFELNKCVFSKFGSLVGEGYDCDVYFTFHYQTESCV